MNRQKSRFNRQNSGSPIDKIESTKSWLANQQNHRSIVKMLVRIVKVMIPIVKMTIESPESNRKLTFQGHRKICHLLPSRAKPKVDS